MFAAHKNHNKMHNLTHKDKEKVDSIICLSCGHADTLYDNQHLYNDLGIDSLDKLEMIMNLEKVFSIEISSDLAEEINTIGDLYLVVDQKKNQ